MHPQLYVRAYVWRRGEGVIVATRGHDIQESEEYRRSPVAAIHQGAAAIRCRLDRPDSELEYGILHDLKAQGGTDYLALPMQFTGSPDLPNQKMQSLSFISFATDQPGGFRPEELSYLMELVPLVAMRLEIESTRRMTRDLLITYLGRAAAKRVLRGNFIRGRGIELEAAIWLSDLRGFTALSDRSNPSELIATLDDYLEAMARPIQENEGEVLKFIGDGLLAIFRTDPNDPPEQRWAIACARAMKAAEDAFAGLHVLNQGRGIDGAAPLKVGIALHAGRVIFGNIGAKDRLDFTVIGRAVNEVARVEGATKPLERPLLASAEFAAHLPQAGLESLGFHALRGIREPRELFGLPVTRIPGYAAQAA